MSWIHEHKRVWRGIILTGVLAAIVGPWAFDVVSVPSEYPCSAPYVRVNDDFCGIPLPGTRILSGVFGGLITATGMLVAGTMPFEEWARICLTCLFLSLLVLPLVGTLLLIVRGDRRRWKVLNVASWGMAAGLGLLIGVFNRSRLSWRLWGPWLYIALAASALILELLMLVEGTEASQG
jgi:hypothetical protein